MKSLSSNAMAVLFYFLLGMSLFIHSKTGDEKNVIAIFKRGIEEVITSDRLVRVI